MFKLKLKFEKVSETIEALEALKKAEGFGTDFFLSSTTPYIINIVTE